MASKEAPKGSKKVIDVVSQDKDWRSVIENELRFQENWQKEWGFLAGDTSQDKPLSKKSKIQMLEEKLKSMEDVKITSEFKTKFKGKDIDMKNKEYNKRNETELLPQSRRPKAISIAHDHLVKQIGPTYESEPYQNYLGSK